MVAYAAPGAWPPGTGVKYRQTLTALGGQLAGIVPAAAADHHEPTGGHHRSADLRLECLAGEKDRPVQSAVAWRFGGDLHGAELAGVDSRRHGECG